MDSGLLYYDESDGRVQDVSAAIAAQRDFDDDRKLGLSLTADTLTGASASGAIALDRAQTFTSPSGKAVYTVPAGETPLDDTFKDVRFALNVNGSQPRARLYTIRYPVASNSLPNTTTPIWARTPRWRVISTSATRP